MSRARTRLRWFKCWADDLVAGAVHFTDEEFGQYVRLLCAQFASKGRRGIPEGDAQDYVRSELSTRVVEKFERVTESGRPVFRNQRMADEWAAAVAESESKSLARQSQDTRKSLHKTLPPIPEARSQKPEARDDNDGGGYIPVEVLDCPDCRRTAVVRQKRQYGTGWVCFKRREGCGAVFDALEPSLLAQMPAQQVEAVRRSVQRLETPAAPAREEREPSEDELHPFLVEARRRGAADPQAQALEWWRSRQAESDEAAESVARKGARL